MSSLTLNGDTSGSILIQAPAIAGNSTLTLPTTGGTIMAGGPAFSAYMTGNQSMSANVSTKMPLNAEEYDTNSNFNTSTYAFTPTVAGYYLFNGAVEMGAVSATYCLCQIYKNGSTVATGSNYPTSGSAGPKATVSVLLYMNGSTDYVELYAQCQGSTTAYGTGSTGIKSTILQGFLARAA